MDFTISSTNALFWSRSHIAFSHHIYLLSSGLGQFFSFSLLFMTLTVLKNIAQVFCTMSLILVLSDVFPIVRPGSWALGEGVHRDEVPALVSILNEGLPAINMTYHW